jgi:voltage-gated potassium channel Kch
MSRRHGNIWSRAASGLTRFAHARAPLVRWGVLVILVGVWILAGYAGLRTEVAAGGPIELDALYKTFGAIGVQDYLSPAANPWAEVARFAGLAVPVVGLAFAFSGQLGSSLAQFFHAGSADHVVVTGSSPAAAALARDCASAGDVVVLVAETLSDETAWAMRKSGVMIVAGDPTITDALRSARAGTAAHVVALDTDDTRNLRTEAAVRAIAKARPRHKAAVIHVGLVSPMLLQEAREMRAWEQRQRDKKADARKRRRPVGAPDARPFSLDELAARALIVRYAPAVLDVAHRHRHPRPHMVLFGFDGAGEAVAVRALVTLWSAHFEAPRITVVTQDPDSAARRFDARYPHARAHDLWKADVAFLPYDWSLRPLNEALLHEIENARGPVSAAVVATGDDASTITLSLALLRAANNGPIWPAPIFMKESDVSEFSKLYAGGDTTPDVDDAYLQAFGACQETATRRLIIDGALDVGAAIAHQMYQQGVAERGHDADRALEAMRRSFQDVGETYRAANRATADHALVKMWDMGFVAAPERGAGEAVAMPEDMAAKLAEIEHQRWSAERLMSGWRPGASRDNDRRVHPNLVPWSHLSDGDKAKDADQVKAALKLAPAMTNRKFRRR